MPKQRVVYPGGDGQTRSHPATVLTSGVSCGSHLGLVASWPVSLTSLYIPNLDAGKAKSCESSSERADGKPIGIQAIPEYSMCFSMQWPLVGFCNDKDDNDAEHTSMLTTQLLPLTRLFMHISFLEAAVGISTGCFR
jgi:hypothetical protein